MNNPSGITPVDVKVLVKPDPVETKTAGGIIRPDVTVDKEKYAGMLGTLVAVGPNAFLEWGEGNKPQPGQRVVYAQYSGIRQKASDGTDYIIMNDEDVISTLEASNV